MKKYITGDKLLLRIKEPMQIRKKIYFMQTEVLSVFNNKHTVNVSGNINLMLEKDNNANTLSYGDCLVVDAVPRRIKNNGNPGEFNKENYYAASQVYHEIYVKQYQFRQIPIQKPTKVFKWVYGLREKTLNILRNFVSPSDSKLGIAEALLIGYRNDLDREMVQTYSQTGVVHIIAISGMHLGLIYSVLIFLLGSIPYIRKSVHLQYPVLLFCLWTFSLLTGASASVLRSAVMFTCIIFGKWLNRQSSIVNSIAASAFLLLLYNPLLLWDVGFLFSYAAITGIIMFQQPILKLYHGESVVLKKIMELCAVTIAAQILTLPVSLYYFHQFPVYFLFSNLLAVPLSTIILFEELALLCVSQFKPIALLTGNLIDFSISCMNDWVVFVSKLPHALIEGIYADVPTTWLLYVFIFLIAGTWFLGKKNYLKWGLLVLTFFTSLQAIIAYDFATRKKMIVYQIPGFHCMEFIVGRNAIGFTTDNGLKNRQKLEFHLKAARGTDGVFMQDTEIQFQQSENKLIVFNKRRIAVLDSTFSMDACPTGIEVDNLILINNPSVSLKDLSEKLHPKCLILDGSDRLWKIEQWKKEADSLHLQCFTTTEKGAFVASLR